MLEEVRIFVDSSGRRIRLTDERNEHLQQHAEMVGQLERIRQTIVDPDAIITTVTDKTVHVYHRHYEKTPVTSKHLLVVVKVLEDDAFVLTAFFSSRRKRGTTLWQR